MTLLPVVCVNLSVWQVALFDGGFVSVRSPNKPVYNDRVTGPFTAVRRCSK